jgi:hypothetical protein
MRYIVLFALLVGCVQTQPKHISDKGNYTVRDKRVIRATTYGAVCQRVSKVLLTDEESFNCGILLMGYVDYSFKAGEEVDIESFVSAVVRLILKTRGDK